MELQYYHIPFGCILQQYYLYFCGFYSFFIIILFIRGIITHLDHSLPSKLRHIMIHLSLIITAYRTSGIEQTGKQIVFDIPHFSSILPKTIYYILYMRIINIEIIILFCLFSINIIELLTLLLPECFQIFI